MSITSREYKVIVDSSLFEHVEIALNEIEDDLKRLAESVGDNVEVDGEFNPGEAKERSIVFLDTSGFTLRDNGLLLRQRVKRKSGKAEYTLKCRSEDRYYAANEVVNSNKAATQSLKLEEDIGVPFVSRYSQSATIGFDEDHEFGGDWLPQTLGDAAKIFPRLFSVTHNGATCSPSTRLEVVNGLVATERVFEGLFLRIPGMEAIDEKDRNGKVAIVLWSKGKKGRILTAELSFRITNSREEFPLEVVMPARRFFEGLQRQDWAKPEAMTKTQYMYGG
jgi:hypothetical protein